MLTRHQTVLAATRTFIHEWNEPSCLCSVSIHQMAPPREVAHIQLQLITHLSQKDERLSWPSWLTCSGRFTLINGHPSAAGRSSAGQGKFAGQRPTFYTAVPRSQREAIKGTTTTTIIYIFVSIVRSYLQRRKLCSLYLPVLFMRREQIKTRTMTACSHDARR